MANKTEERLLSLFNEAAGASRVAAGPEPAEAESAHANLAAESSSTKSAGFDPSQETGPGQSYSGDSGSSRSNTASGDSGGGLTSFASSLFGGALGLVPLIGGLFSLFGGESKQQQPVFEKYQMPSSISFEAAESHGQLVNSDYGQMGLPRLYESSEEATAPAGSTTAAAGPPSDNGSIGRPSAAAQPQISVNVQAMDAQSFMSYSGEIAKAVREAMLNLSSLNDVVTDL